MKLDLLYGLTRHSTKRIGYMSGGLILAALDQKASVPDELQRVAWLNLRLAIALQLALTHAYGITIPALDELPGAPTKTRGNRPAIQSLYFMVINLENDIAGFTLGLLAYALGDSDDIRVFFELELWLMTAVAEYADVVNNIDRVIEVSPDNGASYALAQQQEAHFREVLNERLGTDL